MKRVHLFAGALVALAALVIGCAGSGGDTPNTTGGETGNLHIEAVVVVSRTNLKDPSKYTDAQLRDPLQVDPDDLIDPTLYGVQDPRDIQTQEQYYFQLVSYDTGSRVIVSSSEIEWTTSNSEGLYGQIGNNSGLFVASSRVTSNNQYIFAQHRGTRYQVLYRINPRQVRLIGKILTEGTDAPVKNVELFFFDQFNTVVGIVESSFDGSFRASVPLNAVRFAPTVESVPETFYQTFLFEGLRYTVGVSACKADLPTFTITRTELLSQPIYLKVRVPNVPTPDPTGCEV